MRSGVCVVAFVSVGWVAACSGTVSDEAASPAVRNSATNAAPGGAANGAPADNGTTPSTADGGTGGKTFTASASVARRLSRAELDNTLRDLLGDDTTPATRLLAEDLYAPYDNDYSTQTASAALIDSLEGMANEVAAHVVGDPTLRNRLVTCTPSGPSDSACFRQVVTDFGRRAFRRTLSSDEVAAYMPLLDFATENKDFYTAVELLLRSVLQDPTFLYRIEVGSKTADAALFALDDQEIAARLSFLLWGTTPDDALLADADAHRLTDPAGRRLVATRMLEDSRAREQLHRFHGMWLGYRVLPHPPELTAAFQRETTALIDRVVFDEPQSYLNIFTFPETRLDDFLADHYGLPRPSGGDGWVKYGNSGRAGILSHGSVLSAFSKFTDTSPTQRGIFVRTRLLCQEIQRPPANVNSDKPPGNKDAVCKFDRYADHRNSSSCASCHSQLDPIGFGLEMYDIAGTLRTHDDGLPQCTIAGNGEVVGYGTFSGPAELGKLLVDKDLVQDCIARQFLQFALGRKPELDDDGAAAALETAFAQNGYQLRELILGYVASPAFGLRREPEMP